PRDGRDQYTGPPMMWWSASPGQFGASGTITQNCRSVCDMLGCVKAAGLMAYSFPSFPPPTTNRCDPSPMITGPEPPRSASARSREHQSLGYQEPFSTSPFPGSSLISDSAKYETGFV